MGGKGKKRREELQSSSWRAESSSSSSTCSLLPRISSRQTSPNHVFLPFLPTRIFEAMKKKHKKVKAEENLDFPGREEIKFGEVVEAPPKLVAIPKGKKSAQDASKERLRLEAVDAYRNLRGWTSRPGIHLPPPEVTSQPL